MKIIREPFPGCFLLEPRIFSDERGFFTEFFNKNTFKKITGIVPDFVQDNLAASRKNVLRGMHFQKPPYQQAKLVSCLQGAILDIIVDIRPDSPTFLQYFSVELSEQNHYQLYVPKGFAHGYLALTDRVLVYYKTDEFYRPEADAGFRYNDPQVNLPWNVPENQLILSEKDKHLPFVKDIFR